MNSRWGAKTNHRADEGKANEQEREIIFYWLMVDRKLEVHRRKFLLEVHLHNGYCLFWYQHLWLNANFFSHCGCPKLTPPMVYLIAHCSKYFGSHNLSHQ